MRMNKSIGECLYQYRTDLGWELKQAAVETMLKVSNTQIGRIERGDVKSPGFIAVCHLLEAYSKTLEDLEKDMSGNSQVVKLTSPSKKTSKSIPLIIFDEIENFLNGRNFKSAGKVAVGEDQSSKLFAVKMTNDLMKGDGKRTYPKNSIVIFEPTKTFKTNNDILAAYNNTNKFFRIKKEDSEFFALTLNNDYPNEKLTESPNTFARAIECRIACKY
mgnify:CR=1 FL=1